MASSSKRGLFRHRLGYTRAGHAKAPGTVCAPPPGCLSVNRGHREPSSAQKILRSTSALRRDP